MNSRVVWRFQVIASHEMQHIKTPGRAKLLAIGSRPSGITIWAEVTEGQPEQETPFYVLGTGWRIPSDAEYVDTVIVPSGYVWHLYKAKQ